MPFSFVPVDPPTWSDYITLIGYAGALFAAWWALNELERSRSEKVESRQIELAEETLAKFYEAEDVFRVIRGSLGYSGEGSSRSKEHTSHLSKEINESMDSAFATIERMKNFDEFFKSFSALVPRVKAMFGEEICNDFLAIIRTRNELVLASQFMMEDAERPSMEPSEKHKWRRVRYGTYSEQDVVHASLQKHRISLEGALSPIVRSRLNLKS